MEYVTFINHQRTWRLYRGVGAGGDVIKEIKDAPVLHGLNAAHQLVLWVCSQSTDGQESSVERVKLPTLSREGVVWSGGRVGAVAGAPDGQQAVVLELPSDTSQQPALRWWDGKSWHAVTHPQVPDISSKVAWLDGARVVYEAADRRLTILDLASGHTEIGPPGCCPASAGDIRESYAVCGGEVVRFPYDDPFSRPPPALDGFAFGEVTSLRVTRDGNVFTWTEPRWGHRSKAYVQQRGGSRQRLRLLDEGIGAVIGPMVFA